MKLVETIRETRRDCAGAHLHFAVVFIPFFDSHCTDSYWFVSPWRSYQRSRYHSDHPYHSLSVYSPGFGCCWAAEMTALKSKSPLIGANGRTSGWLESSDAPRGDPYGEAALLDVTTGIRGGGGPAPTGPPVFDEAEPIWVGGGRITVWKLSSLLQETMTLKNLDYGNKSMQVIILSLSCLYSIPRSPRLL